MHRHDRRMPQPRDAAGLAQEAVEVGAVGQISRAGDLDGDGPVEPRVARLVDGAEGSGPDGLDELELAEGARPTRRGPVDSCVPLQPEGGAAGGAKDLLGVEIDLLDRALAMRACDRHGTALRADVR